MSKTDDGEARSKNSQIEKDLKSAKSQADEEHKLLLLGTCG